MDKKLAVALGGLAVAIGLLVILMILPGASSPETNPDILKVTNFKFSEASSGPDKLHITTVPGNITFEGPVTKPTPCDTLSAIYSVDGNKVIVDITTKPGPGFCIQVLKESFYKGSFAYSGLLSEIDVNLAGTQIAAANL